MNLTNEQRLERLALARDLVLEVRDSFSTEKKICDHCGYAEFIHWNEKQMRDQLNGAIKRLERVSDRIVNNEGKERHGPRDDERDDERYD